MVRTLNCIVAVSQNMGIGKNGELPWPRIRNDFKYFHRMTTTTSEEGKQNLVIMGRKTWFSIPEKNRPLQDRINVVLSRELKEPPKGAHFLAKSLDEALNLIEEPQLTNNVDMVWIIGGSSVYKSYCFLGAALRTHDFLSTILQAVVRKVINDMKQNTIISNKRQNKLPTSIEAMNKSGHVRLFVTRIMQEFESDTFFPEIDLERYKLLPEYPGILSDVQEEKGIKFKFEVYEKND